ncbi:hypothetical protein [Pedobacter africanus]|uniref:hypothetical protein n=1 Tax=Pedobacter africanus TaxID=151894 RepID=UPI001F23D1AE|nr:hypothetical protein [Pedobacter africanus]
MGKINALVYQEAELPVMDYTAEANDIVSSIGFHVASLVEDGATLQLGIGSIPDQVLKKPVGP